MIVTQREYSLSTELMPVAVSHLTRGEHQAAVTRLLKERKLVDKVVTPPKREKERERARERIWQQGCAGGKEYASFEDNLQEKKLRVLFIKSLPRMMDMAHSSAS